MIKVWNNALVINLVEIRVISQEPEWAKRPATANRINSVQLADSKA